MKLTYLIVLIFALNIANAQKVEAESGELSKGLKVEKKGNGEAVGFIKNNSTILLNSKKINSKAKSISFNISSLKGNSKIQVFSNSLDGKAIASIEVPETGGWKKWKVITAKLKGKLKSKRIYLKFTGKPKFLCNIDYIEFK